MCSCKTPKGSNVGVVKYMSLTCVIIPYINPNDVWKYIGVILAEISIYQVNRQFIAKTSKDGMFWCIRL